MFRYPDESPQIIINWSFNKTSLKQQNIIDIKLF